MKMYPVLCVLAVILSGCATRSTHEIAPAGGLAFQALAIESAVCKTNRAAKLLRNLVDKTEVAIERSGCDLQSTNTLVIIDRTIFASGFRLKKADKPIATLTRSLSKKHLDCSDLTFIYLEAAERCGIDLKVAYAPRHVFVVLPLPDRQVFWETTSGRERAYQAYAKDIEDRAAITNGTYLSATEPNEILSEAYLEAGVVAKLRRDYRLAESLFRRSVERRPRNVLGWAALSCIDICQGRYAEAIPLAQESSRLDPGYSQAYHFLGGAYLKLDRKAEAETAFERAIALDPEDEAAVLAYISLTLEKDHKAK